MQYFTLINLLILSVVSKTIEREFVISEEIIAPDNINQKAVLINKQFPGPEIRASPNDDIVIKVINKLQDNFTMHFQGLDMKGYNNMDGADYITQYPIQPDQFYVYKFNVGDQSGTYAYKGASEFHATTAFGAFIVEDQEWNKVVEYNPVYKYDEEKTVILSDVFQRDYKDLMFGTIGENFKAAVGPQSVLINGQTYNVANASSLALSGAKFNSGHHILEVEQGKTYRFRFIGASTVSYYSFVIPNHEMTIIEADGTLVNPITTNQLKIHGGQRYSVLIKANQQPANYWAHSKIEARADPKNGNAIFRYKNAPSADQLINAQAPTFVDIAEDDTWVFDKLTTSDYYAQKTDEYAGNYLYPVPQTVDKQFIFDMHTRYVNKTIKYAIRNVVFGEHDVLRPVIQPNYSQDTYSYNNTIYSSPKTPLLEKLSTDDLSELPGVYQINEGDNVEVIINNYVGRDNSCFEHPWHLHGHHFYVVASGAGEYSPEKVQYNLKNPVFRDTSIVFRNPKTGVKFLDGCGWMIVRFKANNPGAWLFHDNINFLRYMGIEVAFLEIPRSD